MERVTFSTDDGVTIVGDWQHAKEGSRAVLFLHMMPATRESWRPMAARLNALGFSTLAIDLRGHGESALGRNGMMLDHTAFTEEQQQGKSHDVEAAVRWMMEHGAAPARLAIVGASIGANLAIAYSGAHDAIPATVALSPGLDFHGVRTESAAAEMPRAQKLLLVASAEDEYAYASAKRLAEVKEDAELQLLADGGHGSALLERVPGFFEYVVAWIEHNVPGNV